MSRYQMQLSYKGTRYFGWQRQPNAISVQEVIEKGTFNHPARRDSCCWRRPH
jgi:tRNA U38,U39,U40 pseudouridine synthase TruA